VPQDLHGDLGVRVSPEDQDQRVRGVTAGTGFRMVMVSVGGWCQDAGMDLSRAPAALTRRRRVWLALEDAHLSGRHHPLLCANPTSCDAYAEILRAQAALIERALRLPDHEQAWLAERLERPGPAPLSRLLHVAEGRIAHHGMAAGVSV
jgi:hypothetical protein